MSKAGARAYYVKVFGPPSADGKGVLLRKLNAVFKKYGKDGKRLSTSQFEKVVEEAARRVPRDNPQTAYLASIDDLGGELLEDEDDGGEGPSQTKEEKEETFFEKHFRESMARSEAERKEGVAEREERERRARETRETPGEAFHRIIRLPEEEQSRMVELEMERHVEASQKRLLEREQDERIARQEEERKKKARAQVFQFTGAREEERQQTAEERMTQVEVSQAPPPDHVFATEPLPSPSDPANPLERLRRRRIREAAEEAQREAGPSSPRVRTLEEGEAPDPKRQTVQDLDPDFKRILRAKGERGEGETGGAKRKKDTEEEEKKKREAKLRQAFRSALEQVRRLAEARERGLID